jgi:hypothetical protein
LQIVNSVEKILKIPVKQAYGGVGSFCEQVLIVMIWVKVKFICTFMVMMIVEMSLNTHFGV